MSTKKQNNIWKHGTGAIAIDNAGNAFMAGETSSSNVPATLDAIQPAKAGTNTDAFVTVLNSTGTALPYSSYLAGFVTKITAASPRRHQRRGP
jgi:hypothetical protein